PWRAEGAPSAGPRRGRHAPRGAHAHMAPAAGGRRSGPPPAAAVEESEDSGSGSESPAAPSGQRRRCAAAAALGAALLGAAALAAWAVQARAGGPGALRAGRARPRQLGSGGLFDEAAVQMAKGLFDAHEQGLVDLDGGGGVEAAAGAGEEARSIPHAPAEDMHDGNVCDDDEELLAHLCYKKCSLLTHGKYPRRTSAWSCCSAGEEGGSCGLFNQKLKMGICTGYDVSGDRAGNGCPHPAGACLENEEVHLGRCFMKCSELTDGEFPVRLAAATCCRAEVHEQWKCLDPRNVKTRQSYNVGGGKGDGDSRTPSGPHWPKTAWTEARD
ncbi:unnamed protein product, partial [Prorocentrum cordatum]